MKIQSVLQSLAPAARRTSMLLALGSALFAAPMFAQDATAPPPPPPPPHHDGMHGMMHGRHHHQMEHMKKELNLTDDQVNQIKAIHQQSEPQMKALHDDTTLSKEERHSKMMDLHKDMHAKIRAVLNDEQKEKFDKMVEKHQDKREERHDDNKAPTPNAQPAPPSL